MAVCPTKMYISYFKQQKPFSIKKWKLSFFSSFSAIGHFCCLPEARLPLSLRSDFSITKIYLLILWEKDRAQSILTSLFQRDIEKIIFSLLNSLLILTCKKGDKALSKSILICISPMIYWEKWLSNDWCETSNPFYTTLLVSPFLCECIDIQRHI